MAMSTEGFGGWVPIVVNTRPAAKKPTKRELARAEKDQKAALSYAVRVMLGAPKVKRGR